MTTVKKDENGRRLKKDGTPWPDPPFKDPEYQRKMALKGTAAAKKKREARALVREQAAEESLLKDSSIQTTIIDNLLAIALDPNDPNFKWAVDMLNKNGLMNFSLPVEEKSEAKVEEVDPEAAKKKLLALKVTTKK